MTAAVLPFRIWRKLKSWIQQLRTRNLNFKGPQLMRAFAKATPSAYFIQVGSNDGDQQDPLRNAIRSYRWSGLMIEPVPYVFARLKANYGTHPRIHLENVAIADRNGMLPFYHLAKVSDYEAEKLPRWYDALGSFRRDVVIKHRDFIPDIESRLVSTEVVCTTFDSLCRKHGVSVVDLVHIDTEGYDYEVIKLMDFARYRPRLLIYEHHHLDPATRAECEAHLRREGYDFFSEVLDTWCLDQRRPISDAVDRLWRKLRSQS